MFGRNDGVIVRAEVIAERRRGVRLGRVDHDGAPVESEAFGAAIADAVRPLATDAEQIENEDTEFCALVLEYRGASEDWLTDFLGWARSVDVTGDLCAQGRTDVDFGEPCEQVLGSGHGIFPRRSGQSVTSLPRNPASCRCTV